MTRSHVQLSRRFNKINHPHFFIDAMRRKDYRAICRHFLWQTNQPNNQPYTQKSILTTIASLTEASGIDKRRIANVLCDMANDGEIERYKGIHNRVGWNPDVTNRMKWTHFLSDYKGKSISPYTNEEEKIISALQKLSNESSLPVDYEDLKHTQLIEEHLMLKDQVKSLEQRLSTVEDTLKEFKAFCEEKFKADMIKDWFNEHGLVDLSKSKEPLF